MEGINNFHCKTRFLRVILAPQSWNWEKEFANLEKRTDNWWLLTIDKGHLASISKQLHSSLDGFYQAIESRVSSFFRPLQPFTQSDISDPVPNAPHRYAQDTRETRLISAKSAYLWSWATLLLHSSAWEIVIWHEDNKSIILHLIYNIV